MSLMGRLAAEAAKMAGTQTYSGSSTSRAAHALETLAGATTSGPLASRISAACRKLVLNEGKTPVAQNQTYFVEAAGNLEVWTGTTTTVGTPINRMVEVLKEGNDLFDEATIPGRDITVTNAPSIKTNRQSAMVGGSGVWTNLVDTDLTNWSKSSAAVTVTPQGGGIYRISADGLGTATVIFDNIVSAANDRCGAVCIRLISGQAAGPVTDYIGFRGAGILEGESFALEDATDEWQCVDFCVNAPTVTNQLAIRIDNNSPLVFEIKLMRATDTPSPAPAFPDGSGAGYVMPDLVTLGGLPCYSSMLGATNLVDTDLTNGAKWLAGSASGPAPVVTEPTPGVYRIDTTATTAASSVRGGFVQASNDRVGSCMARAIQITPDPNTFFGFRDNITKKGTVYELGNLTDEFQKIDAFVDSSQITDELTFRFEPGACCIIEVKMIRAIDSTAPAAPFVDGTGSGEVYGTDNLTATLSAAPKTAAIGFAAYGWANTGNPNDAEPVILELGSFQVVIDASGFFATNGGATSTIKPSADTVHTIVVTADGVNHTISVDGETPVPAASAIAMGTAAVLGNNTAGTKVAHAPATYATWTDALTAAEQEVVNVVTNAKLSALQLQ